MLAGALVGFGFITKMLQAFIVLPVLAAVYLLAAPTGWWRRVWQVVVMGASVVVAGGWWVVAVALTPAADRPYVGGSQDNGILNLIFGYNGFGRITGNETGSVGGAAATGSMWGPTGITRLFNAEFGNMMSWLLPGALVMGAVLLAVTVRARAPTGEGPRCCCGAAPWSPPAWSSAWARGSSTPTTPSPWPPRSARWSESPPWVSGSVATRGPAASASPAGLAVTTAWSVVLLGRTPNWFPALRPFVAVVGALGVVAILALPLLRPVPKLAVGLVAGLGLSAALAAPLFSTVATAATPHDGALPSVTPTATSQGGPGGGFPGGGFRNGGGPGAGGFPGGGFPGRGFAGGTGGGFPGRGFAGGTGGGFPAGGGAPGGGAGGGGVGGGAGGGAGGGFLNASRSNPALTKLLQANAGRFTWPAATVNSNNAAGYQLASGEPVMAIGGFNGTDPAPSLAQFEKDVAEGKIHYFIAGGGGLGSGGAGRGQSGSGVASRITSWVEAHYSAETVGGVTVYDLTAGKT